MIIDVNNLTFKFKNKIIFNDASFRIKSSGIYGLVAPNGAGKTTLLNVLSHLYLPQSGEIKLFNQTISDRTIFDNVIFLQDSSVLYPYLSAKDHLYFIADIHKIPRKRVIDSVEYLDMTDYWERNVKFYSLGMKQRTLLAIGLISNSKLLFLDEPLNGLDPTSMILIREAIKKWPIMAKRF